ncbi:3'(2'),5'-bisphosphate nucleotidase CysQ [Rodentibacter pneumotropicus]|uniref:3'(2'),5'-bisphosphate nucleotidase CysQ n=1 Tax=Rodentibacter pneumotropicus TaxID=758 RepID=UPI00109C8B3F|nr:3'(2'),5'-bisphosphate nucleotidase CysQ [Rodentibacter pneumotropicus]NBH75602.1 3'(2'),5'-bisphosphate nucleotidase [Rodentibacter pneumotropicus]THA06015.1 3'(2'),5'-bisphosphate nucleotidase [Rodentibacter pneumotropicus]THA10077.1 3'(2'),5'-bisphosphate nucleotidase [Rodentibacter pneumotropicus]
MLLLNEHLLNQILPIAYQAGNYLQDFYQQHIDIQMKEDNTPVTEADLFISQFLTEKLTALFPQIPVLSEENCHLPFEERQKWKEYWLIDPLDGTQQFINRTDQFSVLITLIRKNKPVLSIIHAPILSFTYYAIEGFGAFKKQGDQVKKLATNSVNLNRTFSDFPLRITVGAREAQEKVRSILPKDFPCEFVVMGSSSLKSGLVAEGIVDCYVRLGQTGEWDTAAAEVLLGETNGQIFDPKFAPLTYNRREILINPPFVMVADKSVNWASVFQFN